MEVCIANTCPCIQGRRDQGTRSVTLSRAKAHQQTSRIKGPKKFHAKNPHVCQEEALCFRFILCPGS
eukprot:scaffold189128_cov21-Tisochrysis_lutea.AAC.2